MSAVLKPTHDPVKTLHELLVLPEQTPEEFYKDSARHKEQAELALDTAKSLVYEISEEGRKQAKTDVALIRKFAGATDKFRISVFNVLTEKAKSWSGPFASVTKELNAAADGIMTRFEALEQKKLDAITGKLSNKLAELRNNAGIKPRFYSGGFDDLVKLTGTLTDNGALTKKANDTLALIVHSNLTLQTRYKDRELTLENRCLRADINPPLEPIHLGAAFDAEDAVFEAKLNALIAAESDRRTEMEARIIQQQEAAKQREIAAAVMAEGKRAAEEHKKTVAQEALKKAREILDQPEPPQDTPESLRATASRIEECAEHAGRNAGRQREFGQAQQLRQQAATLEAEPKNKVVELPKLEKRSVVITATFTFDNISSRVSNDGVAQFFRKQLGEKLFAILGEVSAYDA